MAYCNKCGKEVDAGDTFCHACGAAVAQAGGAGVTEPPGAAGPAAQAQGAPSAAPWMEPIPPGVGSYPGQEPAESAREIAERRVRQRLELWWHLGSYVIVNLFLVIIWAITGRGYPWFIWVMIGWGIGVAFHVMHYFMEVRGEPRRERMVQREMERLMRKQGMAEEPPPEEEGRER